MTNKAFNPLFVSALDILTGALGVFIILNFLHTRLAGVPPVPVTPPGKGGMEQKKEAEKKQAVARPRPVEPRSWWRKPQPTTPQTNDPVVQSKPQSPDSRQQTPTPPSPPQDPVAVDLLKQTKGAVVILLQQTDQAKASVEFMLRQGNRTWKPTRASKYQNSAFQYEKSLTYFYQNEIQPGMYEVLVRVKKGQRGGGTKPFSLYGKIIPPGQKTQTYSFGNFAVSGSDWVPAGNFKINAAKLEYQSRLPAAVKPENNPASTDPQPASQPAPQPVRKPSGGRSGKWG